VYTKGENGGKDHGLILFTLLYYLALLHPKLVQCVCDVTIYVHMCAHTHLFSKLYR
jgi:hypothetical protein